MTKFVRVFISPLEAALVMYQNSEPFSAAHATNATGKNYQFRFLVQIIL